MFLSNLAQNICWSFIFQQCKINRRMKAFQRLYAFGLLNFPPYRSFSSKEELEKKQAQMMARGLPKKKSIIGVKDIILVVSGKGGVGKSTTSVNLAVALAGLQSKPQVGLLDADVFGPTIPLLMGLNDEPLLTEDNKMIPLINYGVKCMSMGFLVSESSAIIWRGLMVMNALERLLRQVQWGDLDYLIIDTPPGTGDTLLTLIQNVPIAGVVMVSTPQKAAVQVTRRGATMLQKLKVPVIGIVQNMSTVHCPNCNSDFSIFGDRVKELANELQIKLLSNIPLDSQIAQTSDEGKPITISSPNSVQGQCYKRMATEVDSLLKIKIASET